MKCLIQRVKHAQVQVQDTVVGQIGPGLLLFICAEPDDDHSTVKKAVDKILKLRIFSDDQGKMNRSVQQTGGGLLIVSQFTLAADTRRGNRPSFTESATPAHAKAMYEAFIDYAQQQHPEVATGIFAADMQVALVNDGPVTIPIDF